MTGQWQLPLHLDASARVVYDFADPDEREEAYQLVLLEAASQAGLEQWLNGPELRRLWPDLYLPRVFGRAGKPSTRSWLERARALGAAAVAGGPPHGYEPAASPHRKTRSPRPAGNGFALAVEPPSVAHGLLARLTQDVDLPPQAGGPGHALKAVHAALTADGFDMLVVQAPTDNGEFAQLQSLRKVRQPRWTWVGTGTRMRRSP